MSEEQGTVTQAPAAETAAPSSNSGNPVEFFGHKSSSVDLTTPTPRAEPKPPETDKVEAKAGQGEDSQAAPAEAKAPDKAEKAPEAPAPIGVDERYAEMLKNQGIDPAAVSKDPAALNKLLDNYSNMQKAFTRQQQEMKAVQTLKEAQASLPAAPQAAQEPVPLSPIEEYEQAFAYTAQPYLAANGVQDMQGLWEKNPNLAAYLEAEHNKGMFKAMREESVWQANQANEKMKAESQKQQFQKDLSDAETFTTNNLAEAKRNYPELDKLFDNSGVNAFLKHLEDHYSIPRTFVLSDKKWVDFFVKSAAAQDALTRMPDHDKEIIEAHMKALEKKSAAQLPSSAGGTDNFEPQKETEKSAWRSSGGRGVAL